VLPSVSYIWRMSLVASTRKICGVLFRKKNRDRLTMSDDTYESAAEKADYFNGDI
jgi:hypothetical protein